MGRLKPMYDVERFHASLIIVSSDLAVNIQLIEVLVVRFFFCPKVRTKLARNKFWSRRRADRPTRNVHNAPPMRQFLVLGKAYLDGGGPATYRLYHVTDWFIRRRYLRVRRQSLFPAPRPGYYTSS